MNLNKYGQLAKNASKVLSKAPTQQKNEALLKIAELLIQKQDLILSANQKDLNENPQLDSAMQDRLKLNENKIQQMALGIRQIVQQSDPVGEITGMKMTEKGLNVGRMRVSLGVIGMIFESRPNVTIDASALCIKSGNAVILRGGKEALNSNLALLSIIQEGLKQAHLPADCVQLIPKTDRELVTAMLHAKEYIDVMIPRGGKGLVELVSQEARMPVIKHLDGICHIYVDKQADMEKALRVCDNGKTYRYGICGSTETLLVHQDMATQFLPQIAEIYRKKGVEMRGCSKTLTILTDIKHATSEDWDTEYLAPIISIKIVVDYANAVEHIHLHSSKHTDSIITENLTTAWNFLREVDSASVMVNTPTCFADGFEYGLGAEIGISTDKIHWRGPVGLLGLTAEKFIIMSDGVTR